MKKQKTTILLLPFVLLLSQQALFAGEASASASAQASGTGTASASAGTTSSSENAGGISDTIAKTMSSVFGNKKNPADAALSAITGGGVGPGGVGVNVGDISIFEQTVVEATNRNLCATAQSSGKGSQASVQSVYVGPGSANVIVGAAGQCSDIDQESLATTTKTTSKGEKSTSAFGKAGETAKIIKTSQLLQNNLGTIHEPKFTRIPLKAGLFTFKFQPTEGKANGRSVSVLSQIVPFTQAIAYDEGLKYQPNHHILLLWARVEPPYQRASRNSDDWAWKEVIAIPFANNALNQGKSIPIFAWKNGNITMRFNNDYSTTELDEFIYVQADAAE